MNIIGQKVILRALEPEDNDLLLQLINDPDTEKMLGGASSPVSAASQKKWYESQEKRDDVLRLAIATKENPKQALGTVILSDIDMKNGVAEIHIKLVESGRGKGFGTDAVSALIKHAFVEMRLNCIYAEIVSYNQYSIKLFEKCGFKKDGTLRQRVYKDGKYHDVYAYSILGSEI